MYLCRSRCGLVLVYKLVRHSSGRAVDRQFPRRTYNQKLPSVIKLQGTSVISMLVVVGALCVPAMRAINPCQLRSTRPTMSGTGTGTARAAVPDVTEAAAALKGQLHAQAAPAQVRGLDERLFVLNKLLINTVKGSIDGIYQDDGTLLQDVRRFYVLETVARVPYFAYLSVLHLRETFGERDLRDIMRLHYAEADNELHHLLVMESLGGNDRSFDRTLAKTMAFFYYWYVVGVYALSPEAAYHLSELIEDHAFQTYDDFLRRKGDELQGLPVPAVAREYYEADDKFLFDLVTQSCRIDRIDIAEGCPRRPNLKTLQDVFVCIRNDEQEVRRAPLRAQADHSCPRPGPRCLTARSLTLQRALAALGVSVHAGAARPFRRRGRVARPEHVPRESPEHRSRAIPACSRQQRSGCCWGGGGPDSRRLVAHAHPVQQCTASLRCMRCVCVRCGIGSAQAVVCRRVGVGGAGDAYHLAFGV